MYVTDPKVHFYEILLEFQHFMEFGARDIAAVFDLNYADARKRISLLHKWGLVHIVTPAWVPTRAATYKVSEWGIRYLQDQGYLRLTSPTPTPTPPTLPTSETNAPTGNLPHV